MSDSVENWLGLLRIHIYRGINLAVRDIHSRSSDPYIVVQMGNRKVKTRVVRRNVNPEWNEDLTLAIADPNTPIKIKVFDKDSFKPDDKLGDAEFDIKHLFEVVNMQLEGVPSGTIITKVTPNRQNCLAEESCIKWVDGKIVQNMFLKLRNVESGEVELQLRWIDNPSFRGSTSNGLEH